MAAFEDAVCKTEYAGSRPDSTRGTDDRKSYDVQKNSDLNYLSHYYSIY